MIFAIVPKIISSVPKKSSSQINPLQDSSHRYKKLLWVTVTENYSKKRSLVRKQQDIENSEVLGIIANVLKVIKNATESKKTRMGSVPGRANIDREHIRGHLHLKRDYFDDDAIFKSKFRRRFRMRKGLFMRITDAVTAHDSYFVQKANAAGKLGLAPVQKTTTAIRLLAYGVSADSIDEYVRVGETTALEALKRFCKAVDEVFSGQYLRRPTGEDIARLHKEGEERGFPGMLGSIDCMHWTWKNCPTAWHGQYKGKEHVPSLVLEAVASKDLWIWHAFFGLPGTLNDINVLDRSAVFSPYENGQVPDAPFVVNGKSYDMGYYLADGIYPDYANLVKAFKLPSTPKQKHFTMMQESCRKDVERAFGVLQARFNIVRTPARLWKTDDLASIMRCCIILHNMIIEDERDEDGLEDMFPNVFEGVVDVSRDTGVSTFNEFVTRRMNIRNKSLCRQLRDDLIDHQWNRAGDEQ